MIIIYLHSKSLRRNTIYLYIITVWPKYANQLRSYLFVTKAKLRYVVYYLIIYIIISVSRLRFRHSILWAY